MVCLCAGALGVSQPISYQGMLSHLQGAVSVTVFSVCVYGTHSTCNFHRDTTLYTSHSHVRKYICASTDTKPLEICLLVHVRHTAQCMHAKVGCVSLPKGVAWLHI